MKTINLTVSERLGAINILNGFKGSLEKLATILEDIKKISISGEESKEIGMFTEGDGNTRLIKWDQSKEVSKDISLQDATLDYLISSIKVMSEKNELGIGDSHIITLNGKLNGEKGS